MSSKKKNNGTYKAIFGPPSPDPSYVRKSRSVDKVISRYFHNERDVLYCNSRNEKQ